MKALSKFYSVSIDELLSGDELLILAEENTRQKEKHYHDLVFGLLDLSISIFLFLPFFGQTADGSIQAVSLLSLAEIAPWLKGCYLASVITMTLWGIITLALQNCSHFLWVQCKYRVSLLFGGLSVLLFIIILILN